MNTVSGAKGVSLDTGSQASPVEGLDPGALTILGQQTALDARYGTQFAGMLHMCPHPAWFLKSGIHLVLLRRVD